MTSTTVVISWLQMLCNTLNMHAGDIITPEDMGQAVIVSIKTLVSELSRIDPSSNVSDSGKVLCQMATRKDKACTNPAIALRTDSGVIKQVCGRHVAKPKKLKVSIEPSKKPGGSLLDRILGRSNNTPEAQAEIPKEKPRENKIRYQARKKDAPIRSLEEAQSLLNFHRTGGRVITKDTRTLTRTPRADTSAVETTTNNTKATTDNTKATTSDAKINLSTATARSSLPSPPQSTLPATDKEVPSVSPEKLVFRPRPGVPKVDTKDATSALLSCHRVPDVLPTPATKVSTRAVPWVRPPPRTAAELCAGVSFEQPPMSDARREWHEANQAADKARRDKLREGRAGRIARAKAMGIDYNG